MKSTLIKSKKWLWKSIPGSAKCSLIKLISNTTRNQKEPFHIQQVSNHIFPALPPKDSHLFHKRSAWKLSRPHFVWKTVKRLHNNLILIRPSQLKKWGTEGMQSEAKWERKQKGAWGGAIDGSSTKGTQYAAAQNKECKTSAAGTLAAPITEREGWKRRVEQCRSVPCSEDVFLSVLLAPLLSQWSSEWGRTKGWMIPEEGGLRFGLSYTCSTH